MSLLFTSILFAIFAISDVSLELLNLDSGISVNSLLLENFLCDVSLRDTSQNIVEYYTLVYYSLIPIMLFFLPLLFFRPRLISKRFGTGSHIVFQCNSKDYDNLRIFKQEVRRTTSFKIVFGNIRKQR